MRTKRAVFFDRDGTLMEDAGYIRDPKLVRLYPGVTDAIRSLKAAGFLIFIVTNQAGIPRGLFTEAEYRAVQTEFLRQLGPALIDASYYCADHPDSPSTRRKPAPGMLLEAAAEFGIDLARSFMVGDKTLDIEAGKRAGAIAVQVKTGYGAEQAATPDYVADDVPSAARWILARA